MEAHTAISLATLRRFGLVVGAVFALVGIKPLVAFSHFTPHVVEGASPRIWALGLGGALIALGILFPAALRLPYRGWMRAGEVLGWINGHLLLGVVFFLVVSPLGIIRRIAGKDGMNRRIDPGAKSYRIMRPAGQPSSLSDQF